MKTHIGLMTAHFAGNKGSAAMLQSIVKNIMKQKKDVDFLLFSVYPEEDRELNPYANLEVIPTDPKKMVFIAFPLALIYYLLKFFSPIKKIILKNKFIKSFETCDMIVDAAGISFADSRGFIMNTYNFIYTSVPLLLKKPIIKVSQAIGPNEKWYNRFYAKLLLKKHAYINARGEDSLMHTKKITQENVGLAADIAFLMPTDVEIEQSAQQIMSDDNFYKNKFIALSISSVVYKNCLKAGIDYVGIMRNFVDYLNSKELGVLLVANAAREGKENLRNNDLPVCKQVYDSIENKNLIRWYNRAFKPEAIRHFISKSEILVASRFHAMIFALEKAVPVLMVGWSHKYGEVLDMFELGKLAVDYKTLNIQDLTMRFEQVEKSALKIREQIKEHIEDVKGLARRNFQIIFTEIDKIRTIKEKYIGKVTESYAGYMLDENIRDNAASGGMVTGLLLHLLKTHKIDGALIARQFVKNGKIFVDSFIATTPEEVLDCSTSIYTEFNLDFKKLENFEGKAAVVCLPCQLKIIEALPEGITEKIAYKLCLFCGGVAKPRLMERVMMKNGIDLNDVERIYARKGHWRGNMGVKMKSGDIKELSYLYNWSIYKNAFYYSAPKCFRCMDHFGYQSDLSFGDIWLAEMKKNPIKHTAVLARNEKAAVLLNEMEQDAAITEFNTDNIIKGNSRSLSYKFKTAQARIEIGKKHGMKGPKEVLEKSKWNHYLAARLIIKNIKRSKDEDLMDKTFKKSSMGMFLYMGFIRFLLSF